MARNESPFVKFPRRQVVGNPGLAQTDLARSSSAPTRSIVWLRGDHDASTVAELASSLSDAMAAADGDVVIDLSGVEFMSAATVGVILRARELLQVQTRLLDLRRPSPSARRVLGLCGLNPAADGRVVLSTPGPTESLVGRLVS